MRKIYKISLALFSILSISLSLSAQKNYFTDAGENATVPTTGQRTITPDRYRVFTADIEQLKDFLWTLPLEKNVTDRKLAPVLALPMPDGSMARFRVWESPIMEQGLADKFPEMKTFAGQGIDDPYATIRFDYGPSFGFSAQILSAVQGRVFIDPYARWDIHNYISYYSRDAKKQDPFICNTEMLPGLPEQVSAGPCRGTQLYTYRLALACTGEYAIAVCAPNPPTVPATANAMLIAVNRVSGVYETEISVRLSLIANNNLLIYLDPATDPYTNNNGGAMLSQNINNCNSVIGSANYDIGHVFSTGGGGVAFLGVVCGANKAGGVTGLPNPVGDDFYIDYVAHEMGHQFGGNHSFNSVVSNCGGGNRNGSTAYEVGSGTTIMAYAGICGSDNIQPHSDPFFHTISFDEISNFVSASGGSCAAVTANGNILPVITSMDNNGINIPLNTPFILNASATDANGDALTYCWEEWDLGPAGAWNSGATSPTAPLFKSRVPKTTGQRIFPDMAVILAGYPPNPPATMGGLKGETLPLVGRAMKFRLTVRDNRAGGGGVVTGGDGCQAGFTGIFQVNAIDNTGPFIVTAPNGSETWVAGSQQAITWNVAGTSTAPINVSNVRITLSTDGGLTYPIVLAASTANDGSETFTLPCITTSTAKVKIEALGNIFFDISDADFSILPGFDFDSPAPVISPCPVPPSMSVNLGTLGPCGFSNAITLSASGNPAGTTVGFSSNPVMPGNSVTVTLNGTNTLASGTYPITISGNAAGAPQKSRVVTFIISTPASPSITNQPVNQTVCAGNSATFTVTANNATSYQWQLSSGGGPFVDIPGATTTSYTVSNTTVAMNGNQYRVIASAACTSPVTSNPATLTVVAPAAITVQPQNKGLCAGDNISFTATATGATFYQWQVNSGSGFTNVSNGGVYSGATTNTLTITNATTALTGYQYRLQVSNATCTTPVSSNGAVLTVHPLPAVALDASPLQSLLPGKTTTLTAFPSGATLGSSTITNTWYFNGNSFTNTGTTYLVDVEHVGDYQVKIRETWTDGSVCNNQSPVVTIDATVSNKLFIFPSPNDGKFTVSYYNNGGASTERRIVIFDPAGNKVYDRQFPITGAYTLLHIDLRVASRGIYFVSVGDAAGKKLAEGKVHVR